MTKNKLIIAAAGAGKTTHLINEALNRPGEVLITTYTEANEEEIKRKIIKLNKAIPANITIQTWFSFLIQHGIRPYQDFFTDQKIRGLIFVNSTSGTYKGSGGKIYSYPEANFEQYYLNSERKVFSDKLSKLAVNCNEKSSGNVIDRISRLFQHIYIDEVQDLAGFDLDIIKLLFQSKSSVVLVGDPRQVTYLTHHSKRYSQYKDGRIDEFVTKECKKLGCTIDNETLKYSHRNNLQICSFSSKLYPQFPPSEACSCVECRKDVQTHNGVFIVKPEFVNGYIDTYKPTVLRYSCADIYEWTFGRAKGLGFSRVLIYPPNTFVNYLKNGSLTKIVNGKAKDTFDIAKLYVAITRARHSVGIVYNYKDNDAFIGGIEKFVPTK